MVQAIGGTDRRVLVPMGLHPRVLPTGHLTYVHNGTLYAVAFDAALRTVSGDTMPLVEGIPFSSFSAVAQFAVSQNGSLIYGQGVPTATSFQLASVDRSGLDRQLPVPVSRYQQPRLSPDKRRLVVSAAGQISMWTFATETLMRVTTNEHRPTSTRRGWGTAMSYTTLPTPTVVVAIESFGDRRTAPAARR